jgi:hypothetical protein
MFEQLKRLALVAAVLLAGCGGGSDDPASTPPATVGPPVVDSARTSSASIGPEGGTLRTTAADGVEYTLTVPAGALTETVTIRMTPIVDINNPVLANGLTGAVQFEPSGLRFQRLATLRIGAVDVLPTGSRRVGFSSASDGSRVQLSPPVVSSGGTEILVAHFSSAGAANLTPEQIDEVPLEAIADPSDPMFWFDSMVRRSAGGNPADIAEVFTNWLDQFVNDEIAKASGTFESVFRADVAYGTWVGGLGRAGSMFLGDEEVAELRALLAPEQAKTQAALARAFLAFIDSRLASCPSSADPVRDEVSEANFIQTEAARFDIDTVAFGLDRPGFLRKVNDCLRPVLDPITLPSPLSPGRPVSLDARAQVVFIDRPNPVGAPFKFTITATDATVATPVGFSDADGRYTTVFTPSTTAPTFDVRACLELNSNGDLNFTTSTDICVTQQVGSQSVVLAGRITVNRVTNGALGTTVGTVDFRVRADLDGTLTVVGASGQVTRNAERQEKCLLTGEQFLLRLLVVDTITQGKFRQSVVGRPAEIEASGPTVTTVEQLVITSNEQGVSRCESVTVRRTSDDGADSFESTPISAIERGADGLPTVITFSAAGYSGRLVRE